MDDTGKPPPDYYADLGLSRFANTQQIRKAWRDLAKATHPDRKENESGNAAAFHKVSGERMLALMATDSRSV